MNLRFLVLTLCGLTGAPALAQPPVGAVQPADSVYLAVWQRPDLSGGFVVLADGALAHPLLREVRVAGVGRAEAEQRIRQFLLRFGTDPRFVYEPRVRVAVTGEVRNPRLFFVSPEVTVADAVALSGGTTERADARRVRLYRGGIVTPLDLSRPDQSPMASSVQSGDRIVVERRGVPLREYITPVASVAAALVSIYSVLKE